MLTDTPGGVIRGYWAIGSEMSAIPPVSVMATLSTVAKIGRSMKNRDNMVRNPKSKIQNPQRPDSRRYYLGFFPWELSCFSDFGFRISDFGFSSLIGCGA